MQILRQYVEGDYLITEYTKDGVNVSHRVQTLQQQETEGDVIEMPKNPLTILQEDTVQLQTKLTTIEDTYKTATQKYNELDKQKISLEDIKIAKLNQLDEECKKAIIDGFDFTINETVYHFSCSMEAQANFQGANALFKDDLITNVGWTVLNKDTGKIERITIDEVTFNSLRLEVFSHINSQVSKLRDTLQPLVEEALTVEEIDAVIW